MHEDEPLNPLDEYNGTWAALRDVMTERVEQAAVFGVRDVIAAVWAGRAQPREFADPDLLDGAELRLLVTMRIGGEIMMWATLLTGEFERDRRYRFDGDGKPEGVLTQSTALVDEQIRIALGRNMTFDPDVAGQEAGVWGITEAGQNMKRQKEGDAP